MFYLEVSGTYYEMGCQVGKACQLAIAGTIDLLTKSFRSWNKEKFDYARKKFMSYTEKICPELIEEVRGISDGSGFSFQWVYLANFYASMKQANEGCSNIIFTNTPDGPILAKTSDLPVNEGKHSIVMLRRPNKGYASLVSTWAGTVWGGTGINEAGLAIGGSSCSAKVPVPNESINPHCLSRYILSRAASVAGAIELIRNIPLTTWGSNIALVDKNGDAAIVEKAGSYQGIRKPANGVIWCTNHSVSKEMVPYKIDNPSVLKESMERYEAIEKFTQEKPYNSELMKKIVAFNGRPGALCRYGNDDPLEYETEAAYIFYPKQKRIEVCFSHADRDPWFEFKL